LPDRKSMPTVQFDPKITTDLPIDWRRPASNQASDQFADLLADRLKRNADADRREPPAKRPHAVSEAVSGRSTRVVVSHARTVPGEAEEIEDTGARRTNQKRQGEEDCTTAAEEKVAPEEGAPAEEVSDSTDAAGRQEPVDASTGAEPTDSQATAADSAAADSAAAEQPKQATDGETQSTNAVATIVVATQPQSIEQPKVSDAQGTVLGLPVPQSADDSDLIPGQVQNPVATEGSREKSQAKSEQQAFKAMVETGLTEAVAPLAAGEAASVGSVETPVVATQPGAAPEAAASTREPLLQLPQAPAPIEEPAPAPAQSQADRHAEEIRMRPSAPRSQANMSDPKPSVPATPQSAQPYHHAGPFQPGATDEAGGMGEMLDQPLSPDGSGPGWALHLAQGAASRRADFIAQLRQHLQNLPAQEQVAVHVQRAIREGTGKFSVQLSPAELGRIDVKLEIDEDKRVTASVTVERPSTLELLQRDTKGLERALHNAGLTLEGGDLSFSLGRGNDQEFAQDLHQQGASATGGSILETESEGEQSVSAATQVMDTATGVVNVQV
jgi:flagellar hook-length control protein FliK